MQRENFEKLPIATPLLEVLQQLNISTPTDIQRLTIPKIVGGENIVVKSQTGSGKTFAYLLPLISQITPSRRALILTPTRELAQQVGSLASKCCDAMGLKCTTIVGGVEYAPQREALSQNPQLIVATPGRLVDLIEQECVSLNGLNYLILDEMDQMLDLGFRDTIFSIAENRSQLSQTIAISATMPEGVLSLLDRLIPNYITIEVEGQKAAVEMIQQRGYYVEFDMMDALLLYLLGNESPQRAIIFTRSRKMADRLSMLLVERGFASEAIHSDRSQAAREHILERFRSGETKIIVATDIVARGIDVEGVDYIFNYGLPQDTEQYIHRIGRTARAGGSGVAITLSPPSDSELISATCRFMKQNIPMSTSHPYATPSIIKSLSTKPKAKTSKRRR